MRVPGLVIMLSVAALGDAGAGDVVLRDQQFAQASAPNGSCMPIGVTAAGELVFPWECREVIERERGPVSLDLSMPPKTSVSSQTVSSQTVSSQSVSSQIVSTPSLPNPAAGEPTVGKTAAAGDGAKKQPSAQGTEPEHVATIPGAAAPPSAAGPTFEPMERHPQVKRLASSRRQLDPRGTIRPAIPPGTPQPASPPPRTRSLPPG